MSAIDYTTSFEEAWPERAAERDKQMAEAAAHRQRPQTSDSDVYEAMQIAADYRNRGERLIKAINTLMRYNPVDTVEWLEKSCETMPDIDPSRG